MASYKAGSRELQTNTRGRATLYLLTTSSASFLLYARLPLFFRGSFCGAADQGGILDDETVRRSAGLREAKSSELTDSSPPDGDEKGLGVRSLDDIGDIDSFRRGGVGFHGFGDKS